MKPALTDDRLCFACGPDSENGLRMTFEYGDGTARSRIVPRRGLECLANFMQGGIVGTLLDEAMTHAAIGSDVRAVMACLVVRFRNPVPTDKPLIVEGRVTGRRGRVMEIDGTLSGEDGTCYAESHARFLAEAVEARGAGG
jgi:acyl-coenzyme A thioesterase PaaI-like protein